MGVGDEEKDNTPVGSAVEDTVKERVRVRVGIPERVTVVEEVAVSDPLGITEFETDNDPYSE